MTNASLKIFLCLICGIPSSFSFLCKSSNANFRQPRNDALHDVVLCKMSSTQRDNGADMSAIEHFLSVCNDCNERNPNTVRIISRKSSHDPSNLIMQESVFTSVDNSSDVYITLTSNFDKVDETKLQLAIGEEVTATIPEETNSLLGVPSTAIPPFGHSPKSNPTIIMDESLMDQCKTSSAMLVGNGVHPYWQCLVTCDALVSLPNVQVADICGGNQDDDDTTEKSIPIASRALTQMPSSVPPKPGTTSFPGYFPGELPPANIAKLVVEQRNLSNPLVPTTIKAIGSLGTLEQKTKKLVTTEFFPLGDKSLPWRSTPDGEPFLVRLIFGRALFQSLGKSQWDAILESLESGQVIEMTGQTRVIDRDSLCKWVEDLCLELEVREFRILDGGADTTQIQPFKHKPKSEWTTPQFAPVTMEDIFGPAAASIEFIDSVESLESFVTDTAGLLSPGAPVNNLMGIDCEWQPNQLSSPGEKQPVLLLQISFHGLEKVYLFDLQTLLRPLLSPTESMNEMETRVSDALRQFFRSKQIVKVGYQVSSDLLRVAASYPHLVCFQEVFSVLEVDSFVKRILQLQKQKKSRSITTSLAKLTAHYLHKNICKESQVSHWSARPLSENQLEYAAIDAAIGPVLAKKAMESIDATINTEIPRIERWEGDDGITKVITNWRFTHFDDIAEQEQLKSKKASQVFQLSWTISQSWIVGKSEPSVPTLS